MSYGLDTINQLRPVSFDYIRNNEHTIGFLAQEVLQYIPESVGGSDEKGYSMSYSTITPVLVNAVQELDMKIINIEHFATMQNQTFVQNLIAWLGDVTNGIGDLFAGTLHAKNQICIDEVCITKTDFQNLIDGRADTTPQVPAPDPIPDPQPPVPGDSEPDPEPVPGSDQQPDSDPAPDGEVVSDEVV